jgi:hypothetical protein
MAYKECVSMRKLYDGVAHANDIINIHVNLGQSCNFQCEYCTQGTHDNTRLGQECEQDVRLCEKINERLASYISSATRGKKNPVLTLIGGEPALYPIGDYLGILGKTMTPNAVILITNLSGDIATYGRIAENHPLCLVASYHGSQFPLEDFKRKCLAIIDETGAPLTIQFTLTGSNTGEYVKLKEFARSHGIPIYPSLMRTRTADGTINAVAVPDGVDIADPPAYACTFADGTQMRTSRLCNIPGFPIRGMACSIARDSLYVKHDGELLLNLNCASPRNRIGNLFDGEGPFVFDGNPVACGNDYCYCYSPRWLRREA